MCMQLNPRSVGGGRKQTSGDETIPVGGWRVSLTGWLKLLHQSLLVFKNEVGE